VKHLIYAATFDVHATLHDEGREHIAKMHASAEVSPCLYMAPLLVCPGGEGRGTGLSCLGSLTG